MELPIVAVFLVLWTSSTIAQPINTRGVLPKEYYQRQNLPEIPGYIPVYIKHDDEPVKWTENENTRTDEQTEEKVEEPATVKEGQKAESEPHKLLQQPIPEQKSKGKKATDKIQSSKFKDSKE